jgi:hypothetical protein
MNSDQFFLAPFLLLDGVTFGSRCHFRFEWIFVGLKLPEKVWKTIFRIITFLRKVWKKFLKMIKLPPRVWKYIFSWMRCFIQTRFFKSLQCSHRSYVWCLLGKASSITRFLPGPDPTIANYNASVVNFYNAAGSLARFKNKNILFYYVKRSSLLQRWRCSCK